MRAISVLVMIVTMLTLPVNDCRRITANTKEDGEHSSFVADTIRMGSSEDVEVIIVAVFDTSRTVDPSEPHLLPVCTSQKIGITRHGYHVWVDYSPPSVVQSDTKGVAVKMDAAVVSEIAIAQSEDSCRVYVGSFGGCNTCPVYEVVYDERGRTLVSSYLAPWLDSEEVSASSIFIDWYQADSAGNRLSRYVIHYRSIEK